MEQKIRSANEKFVLVEHSPITSLKFVQFIIPIHIPFYNKT